MNKLFPRLIDGKLNWVLAKSNIAIAEKYKMMGAVPLTLEELIIIVIISSDQYETIRAKYSK